MEHSTPTIKVRKLAPGQYAYRNLTFLKLKALRGYRWYLHAGGTVVVSAPTLDRLRRYVAQGRADRYLNGPVETVPAKPRRQAKPLKLSADSKAYRWCWQASLGTLGLDVPERWPSGKHPTGWELRRHIARGYAMANVPTWTDYNRRKLTLTEFIKAHPVGLFYLDTPGHAMVLRDGVLTDTAHGTGRRRVDGAHELTRIPEAVAA